MKRATSARPGGRNPANILLLKDDVGVPKPSTHALPRYGHTYGKAEARDRENAAAVSSKWKYHAPSTINQRDKDFLQMNKTCLAARATSAHGQYQFRQ